MDRIEAALEEQLGPRQQAIGAKEKKESRCYELQYIYIRSHSFVFCQLLSNPGSLPPTQDVRTCNRCGQWGQYAKQTRNGTYVSRTVTTGILKTQWS